MQVFKKTTFIIIYSLNILALLSIIFFSLTRPGNNLIPRQMILGVITFSSLTVILFVLYNVLGFSKKQPTNKLLVIGIIVYSIILYIVSYYGRCITSAQHDYDVMWRSAMELAKGYPLTEQAYYLNYANNIKPMLLLSLLFRIAMALGMSDPFGFVLVFSVLQITISLICVKYLLGDSKYSVLTLVFFILALPIWANTQAFYTDSMSICIAISTIALIKKSYMSQNISKRVLFAFLAGMTLSLGSIIKITVLIPVIAGIIGISVYGNIKFMTKRVISLLLMFMFSFLIITLFVYIYANSFEITQAAKNTSDPLIAWIALGLKGNGGYMENMDFVLTMESLGDTHLKRQYCHEYIMDNLSFFTDKEHLIAKIRNNYASGNLGSKEFVYTSVIPDTIIWKMFAPYGDYYWRTCQISFCLIFSVYMFYLMGSFISLINYVKYNKMHIMTTICDVSFLGYFIFLMIWEANNRQLYNFLPILILGFILHGKDISTLLLEVFHGRQNTK